MAAACPRGNEYIDQRLVAIRGERTFVIIFSRRLEFFLFRLVQALIGRFPVLVLVVVISLVLGAAHGIPLGATDGKFTALLLLHNAQFLQIQCFGTLSV